MFKSLELKIKISVLLVLFIFIIAIGMVSYITIKTNVSDSLAKLLVQHVMQQNKNAQLNLNLISEISKLAVYNAKITAALKDITYDTSIIPILDGIKSINWYITGLSLYGTNGCTYISGTIPNAPSLDVLKSDEEISRFISSGRSSQWLIRYKNPTQLYGEYEKINKPENGILSYIIKLRDNNEIILGYLVIDTDINHYFNFFQTKNDILGSNSTYIITKDNYLFPSIYNEKLEGLDLNEIKSNSTNEKNYLITKSGKYILVYNRIFTSDYRTVSVIPNKYLIGQLVTFFVVLIVTSALLMIFSLYASRILSASISLPLISLYKKMKNPL